MGLFGNKLVIGGAFNTLIKKELNWSFREFHTPIFGENAP
jgi:hypothetical protein